MRSTTSSSQKLVISGGYVAVDALGDGIDINGSVSMSGGTLVISGPTSNGNGALDYDGGFEMTGGWLVAAGSAGHGGGAFRGVEQYSVIMTFDGVQRAGVLFHLKDSKGNVVATFAPSKNYQSVVISSPLLKDGQTYTLYSGGKATGTLKDGVYTGGTYTNGTKVVDFTVSDSVTYLWSRGS